MEPQRRLKWMTQTLLCLMLFAALQRTAMGNAEGDALHELRQALLDPSQVLSTWDPSLVNPCTWFRVTCSGSNSVIRLDLGESNLSGNLVPALGKLSQLQYLEIYSNNISGPIPVELGNLTNLISLDLFENALSGPIPASLGNLSKLRVMRLNHNELNETIPMSLTELSGLQVLDLSYNDLSGEIPVNGSFSLFTPISFAGNPDLYYPPIADTPTPAADCEYELKQNGKD